MRPRLLALTLLLFVSCEEDSPVTAHIRARVETDFPFPDVVWVDVVVSWGASCTSEEWFITTGAVPPSSLTDDIFAALPATFDVLPEHPDGREMVTIFVAARNTVGVLATDWRSVSFKPGERVNAELSLRNPCAPEACEVDFGSDQRAPEDWCDLSIAAMKAYSARTCTCVSGNPSGF